MISLPLLKRNLAQTWKILLIILAAMTMYTTVIIYMYDPELAHMLNDYQQALPGMMTAVGMTGIAGNLTEFVHIYLYGFIMLVFPVIFLIILGNKLLAHYVDTGSMAVLLSTPNSRTRILVTQLLTLLLETAAFCCPDYGHRNCQLRKPVSRRAGYPCLSEAECNASSAAPDAGRNRFSAGMYFQ